MITNLPKDQSVRYQELVSKHTNSDVKPIELFNGNVNVIKSEKILDMPRVRVVLFREQHEKFNGEMTKEFPYSIAQCKLGVGVVIHCVATDEILIVEQRRPATVIPPFIDENTKYPGHGRILEIVAGGLDEDSPRECAIRETKEEAGIELLDVFEMGEFFLSPGLTNEKIILFYGQVKSKEQVFPGGGLDDENEDVRVHWIKLEDARKMIKAGLIEDAKTIIGINELWIAKMEMNK